MAKKRSYAEFAASSAAKPTLTVLTADGGRIPAHNEVLRLVCSCLQNAPASDTWDLSSLLVNGSPLSQQTVEAVLSVIYSSMGALNYEMDRTAGQYSLSQLLDMLLFADAVGCSKAVLSQLAGLLGSCVQPQLEIKMLADDTSREGSGRQGGSGGRGGRGGGRGGLSGRGTRAEAGAADTRSSVGTVQLHLWEVYSIVVADDAEDADDRELWRWRNGVGTVLLQLNEQQDQQLCKQVSQQLEALLFVGFKLDLQQLLQPALRFLRAHTDSFLEDVVKEKADTIFTQRVLAAANGAGGSELLSCACLQRPLGIGFGIDSVFGDVLVLDNEKAGDVLNFTATLLHDLGEFSKGAKVEVFFDRYGGLLVRPEYMKRGSYFSFGVVIGPKHTFKDSHAQESA